MAVVTATFQKCGRFKSLMWKTGGRESGCEPCSQTPTYDTPATAGKQATADMLATARIPAATGTPGLSMGHQQAEPQQQKRQQQKDLCGKAIKVVGKEARNMTVNVAVIKKLVAVIGPQMFEVFARSGSEGFQGSGNTARYL
jgi:hypothetical protein